MGYKIAIDGPAGSGKGFVSGEISKRLGLLNVDTGAMYRAFSLYLLENNIGFKNENIVVNAFDNVTIEIKNIDFIPHVFLNNVDVTDKIRTEEIGKVASVISTMPSIREKMVKLQRSYAKNNNIVMDGRDIGSVVLPDAELKIYLTADVEVRAKRRYIDLIMKDNTVTFDQVLESVKKRDYSDVTREISPLVKTNDMVIVDTTNLSKEQVIAKVLEIVKEKGLVD